MHLTLVPTRTFDFTSFATDIPIPPEALEEAQRDRPLPGSADCMALLHDLLSGWEAGEEYDCWAFSYASFATESPAGIVPLVTHLYAETKVREAFEWWQGVAPERAVVQLLVTECPIVREPNGRIGCGLQVAPVTGRTRLHGAGVKGAVNVR